MTIKKDYFVLPIFDDKDWIKWKFRLMLVLESKTCINVINEKTMEEVEEEVQRRN